MASYTKTPTGWRVRVRKAGVTESGTFRTKAEAQAWAAERETEAASVKHGGLPKKTLGEAFKRYRDEVSPDKRGARWEMIRLNLLEKVWDRSDKLLADVTQADVTELRELRKKGSKAANGNPPRKAVSPASVARELTIIKSMFNTAVKEWGWLRESPAESVAKPPEPPHRIRRVPQSDIDRILVAAGYDENAPVCTPMAETMVVFQVAIETAMRSGEILDITKEHYHPARRVVHVPMSKNGAARDVPLSTRAVELLEKVANRPGTERLFTISDQSRDVLFRKARDRSTVQGLHFHDTRREGTSRLSKKVDIMTLARITGHKDLKMLMIYYQTDMEEVAKSLD